MVFFAFLLATFLDPFRFVVALTVCLALNRLVGVGRIASSVTAVAVSAIATEMLLSNLRLTYEFIPLIFGVGLISSSLHGMIAYVFTKEQKELTNE